MIRYRSLLLPAALLFTGLTLLTLPLLVPSLSVPALGQPCPDTATPSQIRIATDSDAPVLEAVKVIATLSDTVIAAETGRAREMITQMLDNDPLLKRAAVKLENGARSVFPIRYDYSTLNDSQTGLTLLHGTIEPPDGYSISPELAGVTLPVFLYDPQSPCELPVDYVTPVSCTQELLPEHGTKEELLHGGDFDEDIYYILEGGYTWNVEADWDLSGVSFGTPGIYEAIARPVLPKGILLPEGLPELTCQIVIQKAGSFELGPPEFTGLYLISRWTKDTPDRNLLRCFYAVGSGEWQEDGEEEFISVNRFRPQYMTVFYYEGVLFDTPYYFRLSYDGEYSNTMKVVFSENQIHYEFVDGDRDGGDRDDQTAPDISQTLPPPTDSGVPGPDETLPEETLPTETLPPETSPAETLPGSSSDTSYEDSSDYGSDSTTNYSNPSGSSMPSGPDIPSDPETSFHSPAGPGSVTAAETVPAAPLPAAVTEDSGMDKQQSDPSAAEEETSDYVTLSGLRIKKHMELYPGQPIIVEKHRIRLQIPTDTGLFSGLEDYSMFRVDIEAPSEDTVAVRLAIDGVPLAVFPPLSLTMPWDIPEGGTVPQVTGPDASLSEAVPSSNGASVTFTVSQAGSFTIQNVPESDSSLESKEPAAGFESLTDGEADAEADIEADTETGASDGTAAALLTISAFLAAAVLLILWRIRQYGRRGGRKP